MNNSQHSPWYLLAAVPFLVLPVLTGQQTKFAPKSLAYVLQAENLGERSTASSKLASCDRDLIVMDSAFSDESPWTETELKSIRSGRANRRLVSYLSIGEAGNYREFWQTNWDADKNGEPDKEAPTWLLAENPDWPGDYKVKYWNAEWQSLVLGQLDGIVRQGFDGVYLDIVDAFEFFEHDRENDNWIDDRPNPETGNTYREDMIAWVQRIASHARKSRPGFLVVPQNGTQLLADQSYRQTISAVGIEDLFTDDNRVQSKGDTRYRLEFVSQANEDGIPVLIIEYANKEKTRRVALERAPVHGVLLLTDRDLTTMGESTPPSSP